MARLALSDCHSCAGAGAEVQVKVLFAEEDSYRFCTDSKTPARRLLLTGGKPWERHCGDAFKKKQQFETTECHEDWLKVTPIL